MSISPQRSIIFDRLRVIFFMLMLLDHTLHGYAHYWGDKWFVQDIDRHWVWDIFYLHNNSVIIPMLFFVSGACLPGSYTRLGLWKYIYRRGVYLLGVAALGVVFLVPFMAYGKLILQESPPSFYEFIRQFFTGKYLQAGPMWVLHALFLYSLISVLGLAIAGKKYVVCLGEWLGRVVTQRPLIVLGVVVSLCVVLLGVMDMRFGAPYFIGFGKLFYYQGSRFLVQALFFFAGVLYATMPIQDQKHLIDAIISKLHVLLATLLAVGVIYIGYSLLWFQDGAYSSDLYFYYLGFLPNQEPVDIIPRIAPGILLRTTMHAFFLPLQVICYFGVVAWMQNQKWPFIDYWRDKTLGLFLYHPIFVIWGQVTLYGTDIPTALKILLVVGFSYIGTLVMTLATQGVIPGFIRPKI